MQLKRIEDNILKIFLQNTSKIFVAIIIYSFSIYADNLYWGDLHFHTELSSDATGNIFNAFIFARDSSGLDFIGVTDHDFILGQRMQDFQWSQLRSACAAFNQNGMFVTFSGYEWTSPIWGHICVHYIDDEQPIFCHRDDSATDPRKLLMLLDTSKTFIHVAHPMNVNVDWWNWNSNILVGAEVAGYNEYIFEYYNCPGHAPDIAPNSSIQDILKAGYKIGMLGASDSHIGKPGLGGLTAVYADSLTRESIARSLKKRRFYATTGERIKLDFSINGYPMGDIFMATGFLNINYYAKSSKKIGAVEVVKNNRIFKTIIVNDTICSGTVNDTIFSGANCYYLRVTQLNGHKAWSSPIWIKSGNTPPDTFRLIANFINNDSTLILRHNYYVFNWMKSYDKDFGDAVSYILEWWEEDDENVNRFKSDTIWGTSYILDNKLENKKNYLFRVTSIDGWGGERSAFPKELKVRTDFWNSTTNISEFGIVTVYPNPFSSGATIDIYSQKTGEYRFRIFNQLGEEISSRIVRFPHKGIQTITWRPLKKGRKLPAGVYFATLSDGKKIETFKMVLVK